MGQVTLSERLIDYAQPLILLATSTFFLVITLLTRPYLLIWPESFRHEWFRRFFGFIGPRSAAREDTAKATIPILAGTKGIVLDIGPGQGDQLQYLAQCAKDIKHVYAIEPTTTLHATLLEQAKANGLEGKYTVLTAGASPTSILPALRAAGFDINSKTGLFDRVIALKSICSCPQRDVPDILRTFQYLLKPRGDFVFLEHVGNKKDNVTRNFQWVLDLVWPAMMGGCRMDGRMEEIVQEIGGWQSVEVKFPPAAKGHESITFVSGRAVKA